MLFNVILNDAYSCIEDGYQTGFWQCITFKMSESQNIVTKHLLIIAHSQSGRTQKMADAVFEGSQREPAVLTKCLRPSETQLSDLLWTNGLIFGTPENFGTMSGMLKDFFDRTFYPAEPYELNLPYQIFISSSNDGIGAVRDIRRIAKGYPFREVGDPLICRGTIDEKDLKACQDFGLSMAMGLEMGIF